MKTNIGLAVKTIKGTSFVSVRNYENKEGEISNQTFLVGISYENLLKSDLETLQNCNVENLNLPFDLDLLKQAKDELINSILKPS